MLPGGAGVIAEKVGGAVDGARSLKDQRPRLLARRVERLGVSDALLPQPGDDLIKE